jgi:hypothetical protein
MRKGQIKRNIPTAGSLQPWEFDTLRKATLSSSAVQL